MVWILHSTSDDTSSIQPKCRWSAAYYRTMALASLRAITLFCGQNIDRTYCLHCGKRASTLQPLQLINWDECWGRCLWGRCSHELQPYAMHKLDKRESGVHPHTITLLTSQTSLPHTYHRREGRGGSRKRVRTKHGPGVHGPPLWTGSMDHFHGPGPWTLFLIMRNEQKQK